LLIGLKEFNVLHQEKTTGHFIINCPAAFDRSLATVQSDDWLLPNVDYENSNSNIVKKNKEAFISNQKSWENESAQFCELATSRISASAPLYPVLLIQCRINMKKKRIDALNYFIVE